LELASRDQVTSCNEICGSINSKRRIEYPRPAFAEPHSSTVGVDSISDMRPRRCSFASADRPAFAYADRPPGCDSRRLNDYDGMTVPGRIDQPLAGIVLKTGEHGIGANVAALNLDPVVWSVGLRFITEANLATRRNPNNRISVALA